MKEVPLPDGRGEILAGRGSDPEVAPGEPVVRVPSGPAGVQSDPQDKGVQVNGNSGCAGLGETVLVHGSV